MNYRISLIENLPKKNAQYLLSGKFCIGHKLTKLEVAHEICNLFFSPNINKNMEPMSISEIYKKLPDNVRYIEKTDSKIVKNSTIIEMGEKKFLEGIIRETKKSDTDEYEEQSISFHSQNLHRKTLDYSSYGIAGKGLFKIISKTKGKNARKYLYPAAIIMKSEKGEQKILMDFSKILFENKDWLKYIYVKKPNEKIEDIDISLNQLIKNEAELKYVIEIAQNREMLSNDVIEKELDRFTHENELKQLRNKVEQYFKDYEPLISGKQSHIYEINSNETLYKVADDSNFVQNKENFRLKRNKIIYYNKQMINKKINQLITELSPQKIVCITGTPAVGKTTLLFYFLDYCLKKNLGEWRKIFFLNPEKEYLMKSLAKFIIEFKEKDKEISFEDILLVIDGLYRGQENEDKKIQMLFKEVREKGYRLLVTIRENELDVLQKSLGDDWRKFENDIIIETIKPDREIIQPILINLLREKKNNFKNLKDFSDNELEDYYKSKDFNDLSEIVINKSQGIAGYVTYLIEDISKLGEFSKETIEKYPEGFTKIIRKIIERDLHLKNDEIIPILLSLLAKKNFLSLEFIKSFIEWGISKCDKKEKVPTADELLLKVNILLEHYTVKKEENHIILYRLVSYWQDAIEDLSRKTLKWKEIQKKVRPWVYTFIIQKGDELERGELKLGPNNDAFVMMADILYLTNEKDILIQAHKFLQAHKEYNNTDQYLFLKKQLLNILNENVFYNLIENNYKDACVFALNASELSPENAYYNYLASVCYRHLGELSNAYEASKKATQQDSDNITYLGEFGLILELMGKNQENEQNLSTSLLTYKEAIVTYENAIYLIQNLTQSQQGTKKREKCGFWWSIDRCKRRIELIQIQLEYKDRQELIKKSIRFLEESKNDYQINNYQLSLDKLTLAKQLTLAYCHSEDLEKIDYENLHLLLSEIYKAIGVCFEKIKSFKQSARHYTIFLDLNEYSPDAFKMYIEYGNKFRLGKLLEQTGHCFRRAQRKDQDNYDILSELADLEFRTGRIELSLEHLGRALKISETIIGPHKSSPDLLDTYKEKFTTREEIGDILVKMIDLSYFKREYYWQSRSWYQLGMSVGRINPRNVVEIRNINYEDLLDDTRKKIELIKIHCLCQAIRLHENKWAKDEIELITERPSRDIYKDCRHEIQEYIKNISISGKWLHDKLKNPFLEILYHIFFRAFITQLHNENKKINNFETRREEKNFDKLNSANWGWVGGKIRVINRDDKSAIRISPKVAVKCFELSLFFNKRNKASSNNYAWALFDAEEYDKSIIAFENDLALNSNSPELKNPASLVGIGMNYMKKGQLHESFEYLKEGVELRFKLRYDEYPELVVKHLRDTVENLKNLASIAPEKFKREILDEILNVYSMIEQIMLEIKLLPEQFEKVKLYEDDLVLFMLQAFNLRTILQ